MCCMPMAAFGLVVTSVAFFGYATMTLDSGTWDIFWYQVNQGMGVSFVFVPLTTLTMAPIPRAETGYATSLYSVMRNIGSSMGVSFVTTWWPAARSFTRRSWRRMSRPGTARRPRPGPARRPPSSTRAPIPLTFLMRRPPRKLPAAP